MLGGVSEVVSGETGIGERNDGRRQSGNDGGLLEESASECVDGRRECAGGQSKGG